MNKFYIHGDVHGSPVKELSFKRCPELRNTDRSDVVFFLGDFGVPFGIKAPSYMKDYYKSDRYQARWLNNQPYTSVVLLGNHDDRDAIKEMPIVEKFGGKLRQLSFCGETYENIFLVEGTQILNICDKTCLVISGANSHDIWNKPLDPADKNFKQELKRYRKNHQFIRVKHWSWWEDEDVDIEQASKVVEDNKNTHFDLILTHNCPEIYFYERHYMCVRDESDDTNKFFDSLRLSLNFDNWYHGHMHEDVDYDGGKLHCRYRCLEKL